ncbi:MAG: diguanylate cyclase [Vicinamibacterales bacterium]
MRRWFEDASIRWKLTALMAGTTALVLLLAVVALGTYEVVTFRRALEQKLTVVAEIVGRNSTAALAFGDASVAKDVLAALDSEPAIESGAVYDKDGRSLASFVAPKAGAVAPASPGEVGTRRDGTHLVVVRPIVLDGERVGTVYVQSGLDELRERMLVFGGLTGLTVLACAILGLFLSAGLQGRISQPILDLAHTARLVTSDRNFSLRAEAAGRDEVGVLVQDFNRMLAEIERQDQQLRQQQESLTEEVARRTAELTSANEQLRVSVRRVEHSAGQIAQLTAIGQFLQSCDSIDEVFDVIQAATPPLFPGDSGAVTILKASGNLMETMAVWGENPPHQRVFGPDECWAFRRGRPHFVNGLHSPLRCAHFTPEDGPMTFCVPMIAQGDSVGILQFSFTPSADGEHDDDGGTERSTRARVATAMAEHTALALVNVRLREALRSQSIVDALTGLFNRRYLENMLERECRRAVRSKRPLAVLMIDVDHFKQFNDTWGHDGGDAVLRELSGLMRAHFRGDDIACRYGGEEFVIVLSEASLESAFARAEELRREVHRLVAEHRRQPVGSITISIGVAALPDHGVSPEDLVAAADRALYQAKAAGRDRTVIAHSAPQTLLRMDEAGLA